MRSVLVAGGTVAGLISVLSYSSGADPTAVVLAPGEPTGLGAPSLAVGQAPGPRAGGAEDGEPAPPDPVGTSTTGDLGAVTPTDPAALPTADGVGATPDDPATASPRTTQRTSTPRPTTRSSSPSPARPSTPPPTPGPTPRPTGSSTTSTGPSASPSTPPTSPSASSSPTPTATPTVSGPQDYVGATRFHQYGAVKVAIRVDAGVIVDAWAVEYPNDGESADISARAIPLLRQRTLAAQSATIATVTGASLTSQAWKGSLQSALLAAGLS